MFSESTVQLFDGLLAQYSLPASHENFEGQAQAISIARAELREYYLKQESERMKAAMPPPVNNLPTEEIHNEEPQPAPAQPKKRNKPLPPEE